MQRREFILTASAVAMTGGGCGKHNQQMSGPIVTESGGEVGSARPQFWYASVVGGVTLDQGEGGGNPFASALIELLARENLTVRSLAGELPSLTKRKSRDFQRPDVPTPADLPNWSLQPKAADETRVALVLVFSDYSTSGGASLPGAKRDALRVASSLEQAGFRTTVALDPPRSTVPGVLKAFASQSGASDAALLYSTGHGAHVGGVSYLLPGDYPLSNGRAGLPTHALALPTLAEALSAKRVNHLFFAGCRNDPFDS
jgi:hypothetical protein